VPTHGFSTTIKMSLAPTQIFSGPSVGLRTRRKRAEWKATCTL